MYNPYDDVMYKQRQAEIAKRSRINRESFESLLPYDVRKWSYGKVIDKYGYKCLITGSTEDIVVDHFIPITWGHVGSVWGNLFPISRSLNSSKSDRNPFEWVMGDENDFPRVGWLSWKGFIETVAAANDLTVNELVDFTYWCEANKRDLEELQSVGTQMTSYDLWEQQVRSYQIKKYNFYSLEIKKAGIEDRKEFGKYRRVLKHSFIEQYHPILHCCKTAGRIQYREKGKYSRKFKQISMNGKFYCTTNYNGVDIEKWSRLTGYSIDQIFEYLKKFTTWREAYE